MPYGYMNQLPPGKHHGPKKNAKKFVLIAGALFSIIYSIIRF
jgi:hypothetical protein